MAPDHHIIDGTDYLVQDEDDSEEDATTSEERVKSSLKAKKRHVWVVEDELLRAVEVQVGMSDNQYAELVSGDLNVDMELVIGTKGKDED